MEIIDLNRVRHVAFRLLIACGGAAILGACSSSASPQSESPPSISYPVENNPCVASYEDQRYFDPASCDKTLSGGKIALVDFAMLTPPELQMLGGDIEDTLATVSKGAVSMEATPIDPNSDALRLYKKASDDGCMDPEERGDIFESLRPDIQGYSLVTMLTDEVDSCSLGTISGSTVAASYSFRGEGRTIVAYDAREGVHESSQFSPNYHDTYGDKLTYIADTIVHEVLHGLSLGHASRAYFPNRQNMISNAPLNQTDFNLLKILETAALQEYGNNDSIMGSQDIGLNHSPKINENPLPVSHLDPIQQNTLSQLSVSAPDNERRISPGVQIEITQDSGYFASIELDTPITHENFSGDNTYTSITPHGTTVEYNKLTIAYSQSGRPRLYLVADNDRTVSTLYIDSLPMIFSVSDPAINNTNIIIGDTRVVIQVNPLKSSFTVEIK